MVSILSLTFMERGDPLPHHCYLEVRLKMGELLARKLDKSIDLHD
jgi:hypothetical protein